MKRKSVCGLLLAAMVFLCACGTDEPKEVSLLNIETARIPSVVDVSDPIEEVVEETEEDLSYEEEETETEEEAEEETETEEVESEPEAEEDEDISGSIAPESTEKKEEKNTEASTENKTDTAAFAGRWQDNVNPQTIVDITSTGTNAFHALITRSETETQTFRWEFDGIYIETSDRLDYVTCTKKEIVKYSDGSEQTNISYTDGSGYMQIQSTGKMYWTENKENAGANREFSKL